MHHRPRARLFLWSSRPASAACPLRLVAAAALLAATASAQLQFEELPRNELPLDLRDTACVVLGDVDGDGDLDLVAGNSGQNTLCLNDGRGVFADVTASRMPSDNDYTAAVVLADVDGDGDLDLLLGDYAQVRFYANDGTGTFTDVTATHLPASAQASSLAVGDVDGDGDLDLVVGSSWSANRLLLNDGAGVFADVTSAQLPPDNDHTRALVLADFDGDGDLDLAIGNTGAYPGEPNRLYLNDGAGTFTDATATHMPGIADPTTAIAVGDVDDDGDLDLMTANSGGYQNPVSIGTLYLNDGAGTFTLASGVLPTRIGFSSSVVLGDVDGDGDLDAVLANDYVSPVHGWAGDQNVLWLNDGASAFVDATASRMEVRLDKARAVALADVDGDHDLDLVVGDVFGVPNGPQNHLLLNLQRQLHAPSPMQVGQPWFLDAYLRHGPASTLDLAVIYLSTAPASIPLGALGTLGIDPAQAAPFPLLTIPQPAGVEQLAWGVPNVPGLVGVEVFCQAALVAYPSDVRLSNVVREVIQ
ncbi:MAG: VCBS repeat-containing protein [Planctomycetota bacterium]